MHVGLLIYGSLSLTSGGFLYDRRLVEQLHAAGDRVTVVSLPWRRYLHHVADNIRPAVQRRLASADFDVLIQDELAHPSLFWLNSRLQARIRYPIVSLVHHLRSSEPHAPPLGALYRRVERTYLRSADGFIFNSQTTRAAVEALLPEARPGVVAFPAGDRLGAIDPAAVAPRAAVGPLAIVFVGNVAPRKGVAALLNAVDQLPADSATLTLIGDASSRYAHRLRRRFARPNITWCGRLDDEALADRLRHSHVLAVPSLYEGFGIVYLEGMGFGLPAIAGAHGGAVEIVSDGEDGFLVPPGRADMIADRLQRLAADRALLARLGAAARRRFDAHPGWDASLAPIRPFLAQMVAEANR